MDANQRSEINNQTNNGANEKWTPGSKGNTTSGPNDHTYPDGATMQQGQPGMGPISTEHAELNPGASQQNWFDRDDSKFPLANGDLHGGAMQSQQTGGSGPSQGITDSHQRQMEMHSEAWGKLEQPVGRRPANSGTDLLAHPANRQGNSQAVHDMNPQNAAQPELQGGSLGRHHGVPQGTTGPAAHGTQAGLPGSEQGGMYGMAPNAMAGNAQASRQSGQVPDSVAAPGTHRRDPQAGSAPSDGRQYGSSQSGSQQSGSVQHESPGQSGGHSQYSADRDGSHTGEHARDRGTEDVHLSNDVSGGLPRSPGNSGPRSDDPGWKPGGSMQQDPAVHQSNDTIGGLPRSPAGANKLAGDRKMDDDTGFSRQ